VKYPVELITWFDAYTEDSASWTAIDTLKAEPAKIVTVGIVLKEGKKGIIVAMDYDAEEDNCHAWSFIPMGMIASRVVLVPEADPSAPAPSQKQAAPV
jgi:hypothetical protein